MNLPVDKCLMLRENGLDQVMTHGDWHWDIAENVDYREPRITVVSSLRNKEFIKIPTLPQLLDFARELAAKRFGDKLLGIEQDLDVNQDPQYRASVRYSNNNRVNGYTGHLRARSYAPELALVALIEEILKYSEAK